MRTPFPSRRRLVVAAAIILFAAFLGWLVFSSPPSDALTISFAGIEPGNGSAVGFWVTNTTRQPVYLQRFDVQSIRAGDWNPEDENRPPFLADPDAPHSYSSPPRLAPGEYRKILVTQPTNTVWRGGMVYTSKLKVFRVWATRIRFALAERDFSLLRATVCSPIYTTFSDPITNAPPKP